MFTKIKVVTYAVKKWYKQKYAEYEDERLCSVLEEDTAWLKKMFDVSDETVCTDKEEGCCTCDKKTKWQELKEWWQEDWY